MKGNKARGAVIGQQNSTDKRPKISILMENNKSEGSIVGQMNTKMSQDDNETDIVIKNNEAEGDIVGQIDDSEISVNVQITMEGNVSARGIVAERATEVTIINQEVDGDLVGNELA